jgi:hypothetical protein
VRAWATDLEPARDALRRHEYERAVSLLTPPARAGDAEAAFQLSQLLRFGRGAPRDLPEACRLLETSAAAGHPRAAGSLAAMLDSRECNASARTADEWRVLARGAGYAPPAASADAEPDTAAPSAELLYRAARGGDLAELRRLAGALPVDAADEFGRTPLMHAIEAGQIPAARELIGRGASLTLADRSGETPLLLAARSGNAEIVSLLLQRGAPVDAANRSGTTPLMLAAREGSVAICEQLLAAGADRDFTDASGRHAGDHAALAGHAELAARLGVRRQTAPTGPARQGTLQAGQSPLMVAAENGDMKSLAARLAARDNVDTRAIARE